MSNIDLLLQPFAGYVGLQMYHEANEELENLPTNLKIHPTVLLARLELLVEMRKWEEGVILGISLSKRWPQEHEFHFKTAFCQHVLKLTQDAKDTLLNAPISIRETATFHYNLACYEAQLGNTTQAKRSLAVSFEKNKSFRQDALHDTDLEPLWASLGNFTTSSSRWSMIR